MFRINFLAPIMAISVGWSACQAAGSFQTRRGEQPQLLCFVPGTWEESIKQLAAETKPRKLELAR
jgi:hypothetical protein